MLQDVEDGGYAQVSISNQCGISPLSVDPSTDPQCSRGSLHILPMEESQEWILVSTWSHITSTLSQLDPHSPTISDTQGNPHNLLRMFILFTNFSFSLPHFREHEPKYQFASVSELFNSSIQPSLMGNRLMQNYVKSFKPINSFLH